MLLVATLAFLTVAIGCQKENNNPDDNQDDTYAYKEFSPSLILGELLTLLQLLLMKTLGWS